MKQARKRKAAFELLLPSLRQTQASVCRLDRVHVFELVWLPRHNCLDPFFFLRQCRQPCLRSSYDSVIDVQSGACQHKFASYATISRGLSPSMIDPPHRPPFRTERHINFLKHIQGGEPRCISPACTACMCSNSAGDSRSFDFCKHAAWVYIHGTSTYIHGTGVHGIA